MLSVEISDIEIIQCSFAIIILSDALCYVTNGTEHIETIS